MTRLLAVVYGVAAYLFFFATFLYSILFIANLWVPKTINSDAEPFSIQSLLINLVLLGIFAIQHSIMARPAFKRIWTRIVPEAVERSTYVLFSTLALALLLWQWRAISGVVWQVESSAGVAIIWAVFLLSWTGLFLATFMINHFEFLGLQQVWSFFTGKPAPQMKFMTRGFYKYIRHPVMCGFIIAFWAIPEMTYGHLLFAAGSTGYIILAVLFLEERDLIVIHGNEYKRYQKTVPMLFPIPGKSASKMNDN